MTTSTVPADVAAYLRRVRERLDDLPAEEREDLLADVEPSVLESAGDSDAPVELRLGPPERFADELRAAAGLPPRSDGPSAPKPSMRDQAREIARRAAAGQLDPDKISEASFAKYLDEPDMPDVDLFLRPSGEQRTSNFLIWQSAYAEMVFQEKLFPDFDRRDLWAACVEYASRDRRFGGVK